MLSKRLVPTVVVLFASAHAASILQAQNTEIGVSALEFESRMNAIMAKVKGLEAKNLELKAEISKVKGLEANVTAYKVSESASSQVTAQRRGRCPSSCSDVGSRKGDKGDKVRHVPQHATIVTLLLLIAF